MDDASIQQIAAEIAPLLAGRALGKSSSSLPHRWQSFWSARCRIPVRQHRAARPRIYLIKRRVRDLEKQSQPLGQFGLTLKSRGKYTRQSD
jgi:hypothetical protein